jgi:hypothetical protein
MKLIILRLDSENKPSPMSKEVAEIQIDNQFCKGIDLTTWHMQARGHYEWQQFMMWSKSWARSYLALVPPSTRMPRLTLVPSSTRMPRRTHHGWLEHYPIVHPWSKVRYHPSHRHTKLLNLGIPYVPYALVHFKCLFIRTQPTWALIDTGGGYHLGAPNLQYRPLSTFPSSILHFPLIALPDLQLCQLG